MGTKIVAVYENGVLKPKEGLNLPRGTEVEIIIKPSLKGLMNLFKDIETEKGVEETLRESRERRLWE
ncbi:hypothetical protein, conserved [Thermococcus onnurineus NA1]|uniref:Antitoxin n=1 Tax=Thermococcus onnurineus (strain NA1) TaxID=523850 RepID=B6YTT6_THEON|nr:antitoxin family protein [Thermococcus onnurineus]ACJ17027.1 hypothetical protein, conserved [Thermococcus onnurineus NA1]